MYTRTGGARVPLGQRSIMGKGCLSPLPSWVSHTPTQNYTSPTNHRKQEAEATQLHGEEVSDTIRLMGAAAGEQMITKADEQFSFRQQNGDNRMKCLRTLPATRSDPNSSVQTPLSTNHMGATNVLLAKHPITPFYNAVSGCCFLSLHFCQVGYRIKNQRTKIKTAKGTHPNF